MSKQEKKSINLEMREISGGDLFTIIDIINKLDVIDKIEALMKESQKEVLKVQDKMVSKYVKEHGEDYDEKELMEWLNEQPEAKNLSLSVGVKAFKLVVQNLTNAKTEINTLLANLTGNSKKDINDLPLPQYMTLLKDFFTKEELSEVFKSVVSLMK